MKIVVPEETYSHLTVEGPLAVFFAVGVVAALILGSSSMAESVAVPLAVVLGAVGGVTTRWFAMKAVECSNDDDGMR